MLRRSPHHPGMSYSERSESQPQQISARPPALADNLGLIAMSEFWSPDHSQACRFPFALALPSLFACEDHTTHTHYPHILQTGSASAEPAGRGGEKPPRHQAHTARFLNGFSPSPIILQPPAHPKGPASRAQVLQYRQTGPAGEEPWRVRSKSWLAERLKAAPVYAGSSAVFPAGSRKVVWSAHS